MCAAQVESLPVIPTKDEDLGMYGCSVAVKLYLRLQAPSPPPYQPPPSKCESVRPHSMFSSRHLTTAPPLAARGVSRLPHHLLAQPPSSRAQCRPNHRSKRVPQAAVRQLLGFNKREPRPFQHLADRELCVQGGPLLLHQRLVLHRRERWALLRPVSITRHNTRTHPPHVGVSSTFSRSQVHSSRLRLRWSAIART